ncbi:hypothetical protein IAD21_05186 [Abditibacteriota bacterium]|nr:hypothetical protein IAD21_05186 [Abditibacteriota bacterium]
MRGRLIKITSVNLRLIFVGESMISGLLQSFSMRVSVGKTRTLEVRVVTTVILTASLD